MREPITHFQYLITPRYKQNPLASQRMDFVVLSPETIEITALSASLPIDRQAGSFQLGVGK